MVHNLGMLNYFSAMKNVDMLIGNSSSGIIEAASFNKLVIDIGNRQKGRLTSGNIIHCKICNVENAILKTLNSNLNKTCQNIINIYGHGDAAEKIVNKLNNSSININKQFYTNP